MGDKRLLGRESLVYGVTGGLLLVFSFYYAGYSWLPVSIIGDRVLRFIVPASPLLGSREADLLVLVFSESLLLYILGEPLVITAIAVSLVGYLASAYTLYALVSYSVSASIAIALLARRIGAWRTIRLSAYTLVFLEALAIASTLSYFVLGFWSPLAWSIMVRERMVWGLLEWASIPLVVAAGFSWLAAFISGRSYVLGAKPPPADSLWLKSSTALVLSVLLAAIVVLLPHLPSVNPRLSPVSVDTFYYLRFLEDAWRHGLWDALARARGFARPFYLTVLYYASMLTDPVLLLDVIHPFLSITLLSLALYMLLYREGLAREAPIAALLAPLGPTAVTFIAGGFQANSLALPLALLMLVARPGPLLFVLALLVVLIHPWTYAMYSAAYILDTFRRYRRLGSIAKPLVVLVAAYILGEAIDRLLSGVSPGAAAASTLASSLYPSLPQSLFRGVEFWTWGSQANTLVFLLSALSPTPTPAAAVMAAASPFLIASSSIIVHRLLLNTPLEAQAAPLVARLPRSIALLALLATIARGLEVLAGMTPLEAGLWRAILYRPRP